MPVSRAGGRAGSTGAGSRCGRQADCAAREEPVGRPVANRRIRHRRPLPLSRIDPDPTQTGAVPYNHKTLSAFRREVCRAWMKALRRRSQKGEGMSWEKAKKLIKRFNEKKYRIDPSPYSSIIKLMPSDKSAWPPPGRDTRLYTE
jgi:hypothetical protein